MKPLVYDFGKLDDKTENSYIYQIVKNHVSLLGILYVSLLHCVIAYYNRRKLGSAINV